MRIRVAQCLCSRRHCIFGFAVNDPETSTDDVMEMLKQAIAALVQGRGELLGEGAPKKINPYCGICGELSGRWIYEVARSKEFPSWEEAQKAVQLVEEHQRRTHELLDTLGISYDARVWKKRAESN